MRHANVVPQADNADVLDLELAELEDLEARIERIPALQVAGVPGRKPSSSRLAPPEHTQELEALQTERDEVLERMAARALAVGRWVRHKKEILYLDLTEASSGRQATYEIYRMPRRNAKWIPPETDEHPSVTQKRAGYGRWFMRSVAINRICIGTAITLAVCALMLWSWPLSVILAGLGVICFHAPGLQLAFSKDLRRAVDEGGLYKPFDKFAPGSGNLSEQASEHRKKAKERQRHQELERLAPRPKRPLIKTSDYHYEYAGYHPGAESTVRVRIYRSPDGGAEAGSLRRNRSAPVIVLSQTYPPAGTSLTNLVEAIAAEVVLSEMPELLPKTRLATLRAVDRPPLHVVEHYSSGFPEEFNAGGSEDAADEKTAIVRFADYRIQSPEGLEEVEYTEIGGEEVTIIRGNCTERPRFGEPSWHHFGNEGASRLVGGEL